MMAARASALRGWRGREALQALRLRRLQRDLRDMARQLRALEIRATIETVDVRPDAVVVPQNLTKEAKPRIKSGATKGNEIPGGAALGDAARGDEGLAAEVTSGGPAGGCKGPANASQNAHNPAAAGAAPPGLYPPTSAVCVPGRAVVAHAERIALPPVSGMEQLFMRKQGETATCAPEADDGKVDCGPCEYRVPQWFGRDCITVGCPLKVRA